MESCPSCSRYKFHFTNIKLLCNKSVTRHHKKPSLHSTSPRTITKIVPYIGDHKQMLPSCWNLEHFNRYKPQEENNSLSEMQKVKSHKTIEHGLQETN